MNIENLKRVRDAIEAAPEGKVTMSGLCSGDITTLTDRSCGTAGCIAGWAAALGIESSGRKRRSLWRHAKEYMGIVIQQDLEKLDAEVHVFGGRWVNKQLHEITQAEVVEYLDKVITEENFFVTIGDK